MVFDQIDYKKRHTTLRIGDIEKTHLNTHKGGRKESAHTEGLPSFENTQI